MVFEEETFAGVPAGALFEASQSALQTMRYSIQTEDHGEQFLIGNSPLYDVKVQIELEELQNLSKLYVGVKVDEGRGNVAEISRKIRDEIKRQVEIIRDEGRIAPLEKPVYSMGKNQEPASETPSAMAAPVQEVKVIKEVVKEGWNLPYWIIFVGGGVFLFGTPEGNKFLANLVEGLTLETDISKYDCAKAFTLTEGGELQNTFGLKFKIVDIANERLIVKEEGRIVCDGEVTLGNGVSEVMRITVERTADGIKYLMKPIY